MASVDITWSRGKFGNKRFQSVLKTYSILFVGLTWTSMDTTCSNRVKMASALSGPIHSGKHLLHKSGEDQQANCHQCLSKKMVIPWGTDLTTWSIQEHNSYTNNHPIITTTWISLKGHRLPRISNNKSKGIQARLVLHLHFNDLVTVTEVFNPILLLVCHILKTENVFLAKFQGLRASSFLATIPMPLEPTT